MRPDWKITVPLWIIAISLFFYTALFWMLDGWDAIQTISNYTTIF